MHYFTFKPKDYMSKTAFLEPLEDLAYRRMLDHCYLTELPLPESIDEIAMLIRMRSHTDSIKVVLHYFFDLTSEGYVNDYVVREIGNYHNKSIKAKASADARWAKKRNKDNCLSTNANALRKDCESNANQEPITINQEPLTNINNINSDKPKRFDFRKALSEVGGNIELVDAFMAIRKTKKATNTEKAFDLFMNNVNKSNMNLNQVLEICIQRDWKGFDPSWLKNQNNGFNQPVQHNTFNRLGQLADEWDQQNANYTPY